jgi:hypothetical protein
MASQKELEQRASVILAATGINCMISKNGNSGLFTMMVRDDYTRTSFSFYGTSEEVAAYLGGLEFASKAFWERHGAPNPGVDTGSSIVNLGEVVPVALVQPIPRP